MCVGIATILLPPTVGGGCYWLWSKGVSAEMRRLALPIDTPLSHSLASTATGLGVLVGAYQALRVLVCRHFDQHGVLSLDWKKGTESLGEPLKVGRVAPRAARARTLTPRLVARAHRRSRRGDSSTARAARPSSRGSPRSWRPSTSPAWCRRALPRPSGRRARR